MGWIIGLCSYVYQDIVWMIRRRYLDLWNRSHCCPDLKNFKKQEVTSITIVATVYDSHPIKKVLTSNLENSLHYTRIAMKALIIYKSKQGKTNIIAEKIK